MFGANFVTTGVQHAITNSLNVGGNAFALFLKSQRKWASPDMKEVDAKAFRAGCEKNGFDPRKFVSLPPFSHIRVYILIYAAERMSWRVKNFHMRIFPPRRVEEYLVLIGSSQTCSPSWIVPDKPC